MPELLMLTAHSSSGSAKPFSAIRHHTCWSCASRRKSWLTRWPDGPLPAGWLWWLQEAGGWHGSGKDNGRVGRVGRQEWWQGEEGGDGRDDGSMGKKGMAVIMVMWGG